MPVRESKAQRGQRRGRVLVQRLLEDLVNARTSGGISLSELERQVSFSRKTLARMERGEQAVMRIDHLAEVSAVLGMQLAVSLHPDGDPIRDRGHLALLERLRSRLGARVEWRVEVPIPIAGDQRSADAVIDVQDTEVLVEAETHLHDIQALERRSAAKGRDLGVDRTLLLVADTRHNRQVIALHPELRDAFPIGTRACLLALAGARDSGGNCLVIL